MKAAMWLLALLLFMGSAPACQGSSWSDPADDVFEGASPPAFDIVGMVVDLKPASLILKITFNSTEAISGNLDQLSGYVDFDVDSNPGTGMETHLNDFISDSDMQMGVDYYIGITLDSETAKLAAALYRVAGGEEDFIGLYPIAVHETAVVITLPRCSFGTCDGIVVRARFQLSVLVGNGDGPTDAAPAGIIPFTATPAPGDFDEDGNVDRADFAHFQTCVSGPSIPIENTACLDADFDADGDIDQYDFAVFQVNISGSIH